MYKFSDGEIRFFMLLGIILGFSLYLLMFSSFIIQICVFIIKYIKKIIKYTIKLIILPLNMIYKLFYKLIFNPIHILIIKRHKFYKKQT